MQQTPVLLVQVQFHAKSQCRLDPKQLIGSSNGRLSFVSIYISLANDGDIEETVTRLHRNF